MTISREKGGFTLAELVIALLLLSVGLLGLAATTAFMVRQTTLGRMTTERAMARHDVVERIRSLPFDSVDAGSRSVGAYGVSWSLAQHQTDRKTVLLITRGPGLAPGEGRMPVVSRDVADTLTMNLLAIR